MKKNVVLYAHERNMLILDVCDTQEQAFNVMKEDYTKVLKDNGITEKDIESSYNDATADEFQITDDYAWVTLGDNHDWQIVEINI